MCGEKILGHCESLGTFLREGTVHGIEWQENIAYYKLLERSVDCYINKKIA